MNIKELMKTFLILCIPVFMVTIIQAQEEIFIVKMKNGNNVTGELLFKDDKMIKIKTEFGELDIPQEQIESITTTATQLNSGSLSDPTSPLNQEARWRTIYASMALGNTLYGGGIPYLLDWDPSIDSYIGFRLLTIATTYGISASYTKEMDLPLGRSYLQFTGANLGFFSLFPIVSMVGLENWSEFDSKGKVALGYTMFSIPYGVRIADKMYSKLGLSNGQSYLVSLGVNLGTLNTVGLIIQTDWEDWVEKNPENFARWTSLIVYSGALLGGWITKKMAISNTSLSEGDVGFLNISMGLGYTNSVLLSEAIGVDNMKSQILLTLAGVNGFLYFGDKLNKKFGSLTQGQEKIVGLGITSTYLAWIGVALISGIDYSQEFARFMDIGTMTAGWYFARRSLNNNSVKSAMINKKGKSAYKISPTFFIKERSLVSGVSASVRF